MLHTASHTGLTPHPTPHYYDLDILAEKAQNDLSHHNYREGYCLNHLYTAKLRPSGAMRLRRRGHHFELPTIKYEFNKRNFILFVCLYV